MGNTITIRRRTMEYLSLFNAGSPLIILIALLISMAVAKTRINRIGEDIRELKNHVEKICDDHKSDMEKMKENTVWWPTCKAKHDGVETRLTRLERLQNGNSK